MKKISATSTEGRAARAAIYREAARMIEREKHSFACYALGDAGQDDSTLCGLMNEIYAPGVSGAWLCGIGGEEGCHYPLAGDCPERSGRVLALCFMAAMVEAGDA